MNKRAHKAETCRMFGMLDTIVPSALSNGEIRARRRSGAVKCSSTSPRTMQSNGANGSRDEKSSFSMFSLAASVY